MYASHTRVAARFLAAKTLDLSHYDLEGLPEGKPTVLYHGTTASFRVFDLSKSRDELVNRFYGKGIFLTPSKRVAAQYAGANRNTGLDPSVVADLTRVNRPAGTMLRALYEHGQDGWEVYAKANGFWTDTPAEGQGALDYTGLQKQLGVDPNTLMDVAGYIVGSKKETLSSGDELADLFNPTPTGAPGWLYDNLDELGLDSTVYRPKVYTVVVSGLQKTLVTASKPAARKARSQGYDSVVYFGADLVGGVPEVAVFDPHKVKVTVVQVVD